MRSVSNLYKTLRAQDGSTHEVQVVCGSAVYGMDKLLSCTIKHALFSKDPPNIGGTVSAQCEVAMLESADNWPRMAQFEARVRLVSADKSQQSEWLTLGTFYTDERSERSGVLSIVGLDAMMKLETGWIGLIPEEQLPASWPITARAAASLISTYGGVQIASASLSALDNTVAFIGLDETLTARDVIASIGSAMGGNWRIAPDGYLTFEPLAYTGITPGSAAIAGIAIAGITIVGDATPNTPGGDETSDYIYLSESQFASLTVGKPMPQIQGVKLKTQSGTEAAAGTEYYLSALCDFSDSGAAALALSKVRGYIYKPFTVRNCKLDPAAEIGDVAYIGKENYQIISAEWTLGAHIFCNISAPTVNEVDHEYAVQSETTKALRKAQEEIAKTDEELRSIIVQTADGITASVSATYQTKTDAETETTRLEGLIQVNADAITLKVSADGVISAINQTSEQIKIQASKVNLDGYVTISSLGAGGTTVIDGSRIQTGTLNANRIEATTITASQIAANTITDGKIANGTITGGKIASDTIGSGNILSLTGSKVKGGEIDADERTGHSADCVKIKNLNASNIVAGTIDASKITVTNLNAGNITAGNLSATRISGGTLNCSNITVTNLSASSITSGTLDANDVTIANLHVQSIYGTFGTSNYSPVISTSGSEYLYVGGSSSTATIKYTYIVATTEIRIGNAGLFSSGAKYLVVNPQTTTYTTGYQTIYPATNGEWKLGSDAKSFADINVLSAHIGRGSATGQEVVINASSSGKLGFFGHSSAVRQTLSTTSQNMGYSAVTASNYLIVLNNLVGILREKHGLIG